MGRTGYAIGNPQGQEFGPITVPSGTEVAAVEGAVQSGYGVIDLRLHFRKGDGTSLPGTGNQTGWAVGLVGNADFIGTIQIPAEDVFTGFWVQNQDGDGVVNFRLNTRTRSDGSECPLSSFVCGNMNQTAAGEAEIPSGTVADGAIVKVQSGFGIVDMAVEYE
jgi:hypothetical protein